MNTTTNAMTKTTKTCRTRRTICRSYWAADWAPRFCTASEAPTPSGFPSRCKLTSDRHRCG